MSSLSRAPAQISRATGYFIPVADLVSASATTGLIFAEPAVAANGLMSSFSTAAWAKTAAAAGAGSAGSFTSSLRAGAGLLRDMGVTLVSANRTFRKIQLVVSSNQSTFGVGGAASSSVDDGYFTGYIELGFEAQGLGGAAPVALFGR